MRTHFGHIAGRALFVALLLLLPMLAVPPASAADDILPGGTVLRAGDARSSQSGRVVLRMQGDGNLVLYADHPSGTAAIWASGTQGTGNRAVMQTDGNLVVYAPGNRPLWDSHTGDPSGNSPGVFLKVQDDRKLVIYRGNLTVAWQSSASCDSVTAPVGVDRTATARNGVVVHQCLVDRVRRMQDAAASAGLTLAGGGYRSYEAQVAVRRANCGTSHYDIYDKPAKQCSPPTARPGQSLHERGLAIDITVNGSLIRSRDSAGFRWLAANAASYGLYNLPSEEWHWSTTGG